MPIDYARSKPHSRLRREEKKRAFRTSIIFVFALGAFALIFALFGINLLARLSLFVSTIRSPKSLPFNQDTIPPSAPQLAYSSEATASAVISLTGYAEPESLVHLYLNGSKVDEITIPESGDLLFQNVSLSTGLNTLYALAFDTAGNESARSSTLTIVVDESPPKLTLNSPPNNSIFYGQNERLITVQGNTDSDAEVTLNGRILVVNPSGDFTSQYELQEGDNQLEIIATDQAGNQTQESLKLTYSP